MLSSLSHGLLQYNDLTPPPPRMSLHSEQVAHCDVKHACFQPLDISCASILHQSEQYLPTSCCMRDDRYSSSAAATKTDTSCASSCRFSGVGATICCPARNCRRETAHPSPAVSQASSLIISCAEGVSSSPNDKTPTNVSEKRCSN